MFYYKVGQVSWYGTVHNTVFSVPKSVLVLVPALEFRFPLEWLIAKPVSVWVPYFLDRCQKFSIQTWLIARNFFKSQFFQFIPEFFQCSSEFFQFNPEFFQFVQNFPIEPQNFLNSISEIFNSFFNFVGSVSEKKPNVHLTILFQSRSSDKSSHLFQRISAN
jgi:hypothetical protein